MSHRLSPHRLSLVATLLLSAATAQSHQVWLEQDASGAKLYFGEFGDNLREASPGLLDKFVAPTAQRIGTTAQPLTVNKTTTGFALSAAAAKGESLVAEDTRYPITERKDGDKMIRTAYMPAARLLTTFDKQVPQLPLDVVPTGQHSKDGAEVQVFYKGQVLPKVKVELVTPLGWAKEYKTDEQGKLTVSLPWKGTYVLEAKHADNTGGERTTSGGTEKFDRASYVTSLTMTQAEGWPALPASPAAKPNVMK